MDRDLVFSSDGNVSDGNGADFANPLANEGALRAKTHAQEQELAEIEAAERAAKAGTLNPLFLFREKNFCLRVALYVAGQFLTHAGVFMGFSDVVWFLCIPGYLMLMAWFTLECRENKAIVANWSVTEDKWAKGKSGGTFFFATGLVVCSLAFIQVAMHCPINGSETVTKAQMMHSNAARRMSNQAIRNMSSSGAELAGHAIGAAVRNDEQDPAEQGCILGMALGGVSIVLCVASFAIFIQDEFDRLVRITEVADVGRAADTSKDQEWAVEAAGSKIAEV